MEMGIPGQSAKETRQKYGAQNLTEHGGGNQYSGRPLLKRQLVPFYQLKITGQQSPFQ